MNLRTPLVASAAVLSALGGVAAAAIALPSSPPKSAAASVQAVATASPEVQTETVRRTIHVVRKDKAPTAASTASTDDSGHHGGTDDSAHRSGSDDARRTVSAASTDDSGHHSGGDDDSGHGRGRGRGGDDD